MSRKMVIKITTALIMLAVVLPLLAIGGYCVDALMIALAALAAYETASMEDQKPHWIMAVFNFVFTLLLYYVPRTYIGSVLALWLNVLFVFYLINNTKMGTDQIVYTFLITVLVGLALRSVGVIYALPGDRWTGPLTFLYVGLACYICDTGAYFVGSAIGKHKMIPHVSPNKTWEGSAGGYLSGLIISLVYGMLVLKNLPVGLIVAGSLILPLTAQVGDLSFSAIKRKFGIKDFGKEFPGHGGILDRVDSLIFCLMVFDALMMVWGIAA
jgi:phosphatidate cytidylyltransferase